MKSERHFESLKYTFTKDEIRELGEALARESQMVMDLHDRKASVAAELAAQIKTAQGRMADLTNKINSGFEMRETECVVRLDTPRPGMKTFYRLDNPDQEVRTEAMTMQEMQSSFGFIDPGDQLPPEKEA